MKNSKLSWSRFLFGMFLAGNVFASNIQEIKIGAGVLYTLEPNNPITVSNPYIWTAKALCIIKNKDDDNFLSITVTRKKGSLNDEVLSVGDSRTIRLHAKEEMRITASPGAEVELLNIGKRTILTECEFSF